MRHRPKSLNPPLLPLVRTIAILYFIYYLWWRAAYTLNPANPFFSWLLWGAEAFGVFAYILFSYFTRNINPREPFNPPAEGLAVDMYIPTYNEDRDILEATVIGCKHVRYPHTTYLLDDGGRPWVKALADQHGCQYIARPSHEHAKAGNINHALSQTKGDFIAILDADMVPQPDYLDRTLGYFSNEKLGLIQMPQEFFNRDSIQHAADQTSWHEQALFFRVIQPGKNQTNSAFWCGSPSLVRRSALEDVGGVATATITEDIHTNVLIHSRGWQTLFVNEPLAFGIAPQTINAFLLQRLRWAQGTMQLYRSKESPLWLRGLSFQQRLSYLSSFLAYWEAFQKIILLTIPILILGFGVLPLQVKLVPFMLHWVPYFALNIAANQIGGRGVFNYFKTEKYNILKMIVFIQSSVTLISRKSLLFKVTPKTVESSVYRQERRALRWHMVILGSLIGAMLYVVPSLFNPARANLQPDAYIIALFWAGYNAFVIAMAISEVFRKQHDRKQYRFPVDASAELEVAYGAKTLNLPEDEEPARGVLSFLSSRLSMEEKRKHIRYPVNEKITLVTGGDDARVLSARIVDLSLGGSGVLLESELPEDISVTRLKITPKDGPEISLPVHHVAFQKTRPDGKQSIGLVFSEDIAAQRELLIKYLFIVLPKREEKFFYRLPG